MAEHKPDTLRCDPSDLRQCMSIHTRKITDSCRDKDCIEDLRVYLTTGSQAILDTAANARVRCAELITTYIDVEPVAFDRNHYCIDLTFYYRILADAMVGSTRPTTLYGLAVFTKRAVLCGEDSRAHIYRSNTRLGQYDGPTTFFANLPTAVVEVTAHNSQGERLTHIFSIHIIITFIKCLKLAISNKFQAFLHKLKSRVSILIRFFYYTLPRTISNISTILMLFHYFRKDFICNTFNSKILRNFYHIDNQLLTIH